MEIVALIIVVVAGYFVWNSFQKKNESLSQSTVEAAPVTHVLDVNNDGKVDVKDAVEAVKKTRRRVKKAADVDGDGRVTVKDVKAAARKSKSAATAVMAKTRGRKPASKNT